MNEDEISIKLMLFIHLEQQKLVMASAPWDLGALKKQLVHTPPPEAVWEKFKETFPELNSNYIDALQRFFNLTWSKGGELMYEQMTADGILLQILPATKVDPNFFTSDKKAD